MGNNQKFKLGLIINPYAGIGGALALKGSDGVDVRTKALAMGAEQQAEKKTSLALEELLPFKQQIQIITAAGDMGETLARRMGFELDVVYQAPSAQSEGQDSEQAARAILSHKVDLLLFAGGDGTARNICAVIGDRLPVLGIPAGCKIHSGVYAITPKSAGRVVAMLLRGEIVSLSEAEVRDIDEEQFRLGRVNSRHFGEMKVPTELRYVQAVKSGGKESDELVLMDIAADIIEHMRDEPDCYFVMGSGSTVDAIMQEIGLENTLLGVDLIRDQTLIASDLNAEQLLTYLGSAKMKLIITPIGGQGHILGRGNQQLSATFIKTLGRENIMLVASKAKLQALGGRPLIADSGDIALDAELAGPMAVITGYHDQVLYNIGGNEYVS
jgi:predicted polyphosphate/ATP-dependent NAD kinase